MNLSKTSQASHVLLCALFFRRRIATRFCFLLSHTSAFDCQKLSCRNNYNACFITVYLIVLQDFDRQQSNYAKLYRPEEHTSFSSVPVPMSEVITEQPIQSYGSQISTGMPSNFGRGPVTMISPQIGIPLPGLEVLDRIPSFKIHTAGKTCLLAYLFSIHFRGICFQWGNYTLFSYSNLPNNEIQKVTY